MKDIFTKVDHYTAELRWTNARMLKNGKNYQVGSQTKISVYTDTLDNDGIPEIAISPKGVGMDEPDFWQWISYLQNDIGKYAKPRFGQKYPRVAIENEESLSTLFQSIKEFIQGEWLDTNRNFQQKDEKVNRKAWDRKGQQQFRSNLLKVYAGECAISGCNIEAVLQAAHIVPYMVEQEYCTDNGILLRADLHALLDARLICVEPKSKKVMVSTDAKPFYQKYEEKVLKEPTIASQAPKESNLQVLYREFNQRENCKER